MAAGVRLRGEEAVTLALEDIGRALGQAGPAPALMITGWSIDSRTTTPGDLFFALRGPHHDGHGFLAEAFQKGAAAAVVSRTDHEAGPLLVVEDTLAALRQLAGWARRRWGGTVIGVTGSAGKTTTKDIIAWILGSAMPVGRTEGNLNNHIGLPVSILRLPDGARAAVLEMGMNHPGEIRALAALAAPEIGVVTNVGRAHLGFFDSIEQIALAKRELIEELTGDGAAVLNADDPLVAAFRSAHRGRTITFGFSPEADVRADEVEYTPDGARFRSGGCDFETTLAGRPGVMNLLAGLAVARLFGIPFHRLRESVGAFRAGKMRGERFLHQGIRIWNDCYNANPDAVRAMLDALRETPARRRVAVLGEMLELGRWAEPLHGDIGRYAVRCGISVLVGIRGAARFMVDAAMEAGVEGGAAYFFEDPEPAGEFLKRIAGAGDVVLFKGSRGTEVERALARFTTT